MQNLDTYVWPENDKFLVHMREAILVQMLLHN
jgi:hypothetical protein